MPKILGIIPARFASTRLPAKPLLKIGVYSMIELVYNQAIKSKHLADVLVATDNLEILEEVEKFGGKVVMTDAIHPSGTDRCYEVLKKSGIEYDYVINIQGDEPFIQPEQIDILAKLLDNNTEIATLIKKIDEQEILFNENTPKVVFNKNHEAIYFSRQTIPFLRGVDQANWLNNSNYYKHIGIYAYRTDILEEITKLPISSLESMEKLEQLRWLENGYKIKVAITPYDSIGIDTLEDLEKARLKILEK
jgi:3-deoxy-manno-octulosonate cytidylyltransferase (CMP-KDO synthetase)